jgi:sialate O-acetylesterase
MKIPVWGKADPGEKVTVKIAGQEKTATADDKGKWRVVFDAIEATDALEMTVSGKNTVTFKDVLIGEVWLCSGQ